MTKNITTVVVLLAISTLACFILVSNLIGPKHPVITPAGALPLQPTATIRTQVAASPMPSPARTNQPDLQMRADLSQSQILLDQMNADFASGDWNGAQQALNEFERRTKQLPEPQLIHPDISLLLQDFLALYKVQLARAISQQDAPQAKFAANQLFGIVSEQRARLGTRGIPLELQRIKFLIKEIEHWNQVGDSEMLRVRVASLRDAWKEVRPVVVARRSANSHADVLVRDFDSLIDKLTAADTAPDFTSLIPDFNREFDLLNNLFQRSPHPTGTPSASPKATEDE